MIDVDLENWTQYIESLEVNLRIIGGKTEIFKQQVFINLVSSDAPGLEMNWARHSSLAFKLFISVAK